MKKPEVKRPSDEVLAKVHSFSDKKGTIAVIEPESEEWFLGKTLFEIVELPVFLGKVIIKDFEVEACFIPGDWLLGMEFLSAVGQELVLNFVESTVKLTR